jgi:hypothetical protein
MLRAVLPRRVEEGAKALEVAATRAPTVIENFIVDIMLYFQTMDK